jgi:hypothetical protein
MNNITVELTPLEAQKVRSCIMLQIREREMENMSIENDNFALGKEDVDKYDKNEEIIEELFAIVSKFNLREGDVQ